MANRILVRADKNTDGTLGLGTLETQVITDAQQALANHRSQRFSYQADTDIVEIFVEVLHRPPTLIIVGAGHVALPLAQLGKMIDFEVVVLDDRPRFANTKLFPMADQVLAQPFRKTLRDWAIDQDTYIVLVTRGHSHDVECLLEIIDTPARYIGMIGSKRRIKSVFDLLEKEQGIDPVKFDRVYAPIGLDIGAENPVEIAVSIIAEIVNIRRGGRATSLSDALKTDRGLPLHPDRMNK
jgi:xanthine dehydrogenase accessory factor